MRAIRQVLGHQKTNTVWVQWKNDFFILGRGYIINCGGIGGRGSRQDVSSCRRGRDSGSDGDCSPDADGAAYFLVGAQFTRLYTFFPTLLADKVFFS